MAARPLRLVQDGRTLVRTMNNQEHEEMEDWYRRRGGMPFREIDPQPPSNIPAIIVLIVTIALFIGMAVIALRS